MHEGSSIEDQENKPDNQQNPKYEEIQVVINLDKELIASLEVLDDERRKNKIMFKKLN